VNVIALLSKAYSNTIICTKESMISMVYFAAASASRKTRIFFQFKRKAKPDSLEGILTGSPGAAEE
jgi:hypothetical protein